MSRRPNRGGMQQNVARSLGYTPEVRHGPEAVACTCGAHMRFEFNAIGQMVEQCPQCGRSTLYRGPRTLTREDKEIEQGRGLDGDWDGRYRGYGQRRPE